MGWSSKYYWVDDHPPGDPSLAHVNLPIKPINDPAAQVPSKGRLSSSDGDIATGKVRPRGEGEYLFLFRISLLTLWETSYPT